MRYFLLFIMLPLFTLAQSKDDLLQGTWVKAKAEMRDGSRILNHNGCGMDFLKFTFTPDGFVNRSTDVLFDGFKIRYKLMGDSLVVGGTIFNVVGISSDTLKLSFFAPGIDDNQVPLFYYVKVPSRNAAAKATFDAGLKDSVYEANNVLFPQCKGTFNDLLAAMATRFDKGKLKASFIVDKKGRVKNFTVLELDSISRNFARVAGNGFGDLSWVPAQKKGVPVNTLVTVTLISSYKSVSSSMGGMNYLAIQYDFLPKAPYPPLDRDEAEAAQQFLKDAITYLNSGNTDKAIELLSKCIEIDNIDLNAYNLRATINARTGKTKEACKDWAILAGLGQVSAAKNLAKYCK